jgi:CDP-diacylglycerol--glycerol-3-phosphate 3-phosphatidyltransferase
MSEIIKQLKPTFEKGLDPIVDFLHKKNVSPNTLTVVGIGFITIGAYFIFLDLLFIAAVFITIGSICDMLDGALARKYNMQTKFGAFLDSVIDRYSDFLPLMASAYLFKDNFYLFLFSMFAIAGSFLVSYTRARAEGLGMECKVGIFERPERSIILIVSLFLGILNLAVILIAVGSHYTALQRVLCFYNKTK